MYRGFSVVWNNNYEEVTLTPTSRKGSRIIRALFKESWYVDNRRPRYLMTTATIYIQFSDWVSKIQTFTPLLKTLNLIDKVDCELSSYNLLSRAKTCFGNCFIPPPTITTLSPIISSMIRSYSASSSVQPPGCIDNIGWLVCSMDWSVSQDYHRYHDKLLSSDVNKVKSGAGQVDYEGELSWPVERKEDQISGIMSFSTSHLTNCM